MPQPALMPTHPAARARARMIIQQFSDRFVPNFYKLLLRSLGSLPPGPAQLCCLLKWKPIIQAASCHLMQGNLL